MNEQTQNSVTRIAGMEFTEEQTTALRDYFKDEWQREEIRAAIGVIMEVLASHDDKLPDGKLDRQISLLLLHGSIQNDIIDRFYRKVTEWNEEALQKANDHDVGVWRSLYDIIVPEMRAKLRTGDASMKTYQVNGKSYTEEEVTAIHAFRQGRLNAGIADDAVHSALSMLRENYPKIEKFAQNHLPEITKECRSKFCSWESENYAYLADCGKSFPDYAYEFIRDLYDKRKDAESRKVEEQAPAAKQYGTGHARYDIDGKVYDEVFLDKLYTFWRQKKIEDELLNTLDNLYLFPDRESCTDEELHERRNWLMSKLAPLWDMYDTAQRDLAYDERGMDDLIRNDVQDLLAGRDLPYR
ncbi:MAG: hypothetical protein IJU98_04790 [Synergistaceae bacterium]|nr:hypothetical protein [Synergistaceae bacterium]